MCEDQPQHNGVRTNPSDNITAAKMREIAEKNVGLELGIEIQKWLDRIQAVANANGFMTTRPETISKACQRHLESRGFKVVANATYYQKECEKRESTTVSW